MSSVREPTDEFGRQLRRLRKQKGWASTALSEAVDRHRTYVAQWERTIQPVNKQTLHKVCRVLDLTEAEQQLLLHLANQRGLPDSIKTPYVAEGQLQLNVRQALDGVEHQLPTGVSDLALLAFTECAGWVLSRYAAHRPGGYEVHRLIWPDAIYRLRIVDPSWRPDATIEIPPQLTERWAADADKLKDYTDDDAWIIGRAMAETYRQWFLGDLNRCCQAAQALRRWSLAENMEVGAVATLVFGDIDVQWLGVPGVRCETATPNARRALAALLFDLTNPRGAGDFSWAYPHRFEGVDAQVASAAAYAQRYLESDDMPVPAAIHQTITDALFTVRSRAWYTFYHACPSVIALTYAHTSEYPRELAALFRGDVQGDDTLFLQALRAELQEVLARAARKMDHEAARAEAAKSPQAAARAKVKRKKQAKRRQAKKKTTKKRASRGAAKAATKPATKPQQKGKRKR